MPDEIKAKLQKREIVSKMIDDDVMALKWMDKHPVRKPVVVERYNEFMGGVDTGDQLLSYYGFSHRTLK